MIATQLMEYLNGANFQPVADCGIDPPSKNVQLETLSAKRLHLDAQWNRTAFKFRSDGIFDGYIKIKR
jgi:hypothetical protein